MHGEQGGCVYILGITSSKISEGTGLPHGYALLPLLFEMPADRTQPVQVRPPRCLQLCDIRVASLLFWDNVLLASPERDLGWSTRSK